ncbi:hypothetical protein B0I31_108204 [Saccharothrix carnea]|uniref:Arsenate reductase n=1 Tax=Saccharothrix carnea TaxID=1280637 RepID=A0A2P8I5L6_SACCR|nr:hypothetical protein [Saccharothrix carnea]PSL53757.1 hypothetical protein B0I31_108204 [Saccharothrix carnea]
MSTDDPLMTWAPAACTLPTAERPLREAEFDELFGTSSAGVERPDPTHLRIALDPTPEVAARAAALAVRETRCCSFFTFAVVASAGQVRLDVTVTDAQVDVLDALQRRAGEAA